MFAKLFHQVVFSSLTQKEPIGVRGVFFMLLAIADRDGNILGSDDTIARIINVPMAEFEPALKALMATDSSSQSKDFGGRRVIRLAEVPGLLLVNYCKYSGIVSDEQRREYFRVKKAESRANAKRNGKIKEEELVPIPEALAAYPDFMTAWAEWEEYLKEKRKPMTPRVRKAQLKLLETWGPRTATESLNTSVRNNWQGIFPPGQAPKSEGNYTKHYWDAKAPA